MSKEKKHALSPAEGLIPQLRFPEFLEKEGWEVREVGEIFQVTRGYVLSMTLVKELPTEEYPYPVFSSQTKNNGLAGYYNEYLYEDAITWTTDGANAGDVNFRDGKFYCTNVCGVLLNEEGFANPCIAELINSVSKKHVYYVGNPKLMNGVMSKIQIPVPSIPEQQKIAACLSSLDELIAAHNDKLDALKDHKKGLLQNLFPNSLNRHLKGFNDDPDFSKVPRLRFPEFIKKSGNQENQKNQGSDNGEWVEKKLDSLTEKIGDGIHATPKYDSSGDYFFINGNNLIEGEISIDEKTKSVSIQEYEKHKKELTKNTILLSINGTIGNVAFYNNERVVLGKSVCYITTNHELNSVFLYYSLQCPKITNYFFSELTGSTIKNLSLRTIRDTTISLPSEIEQQKIASCLSAVDELITAQQEKIEALQQHKKGLMQGLFPAVHTGHALSQ